MYSDHCTLCENPIQTGGKNRATFACGHSFHLNCVLSRAQYYVTTCPICSIEPNTRPSLGDDRSIAMNATEEARVLKRQINPPENSSWFYNFVSWLNPIKSTNESFKLYIGLNYPLSEIKKKGYKPIDAIQESIPWNILCNKYTSEHLLAFGFKWDDMLALGIRPFQLTNKHFTWTQIKHSLNIDAKQILKMDMTIQDLADFKFSPNQLHDLGFTWDVLNSMGANVESLKQFDISINDIKTYWNPSQTQWNDAGFYNKDRLIKAGWPLEDVSSVLPSYDQRLHGRSLRLNF